jgi:hypothetical protein
VTGEFGAPGSRSSTTARDKTHRGWANPFAPGIIDKRLLQLGRESAGRGEMLGAKTDRERAYLAAVGDLYGDFESTPQKARILAYRNAMRNLAAKYSEDHEATIFNALALAVAADPRDKTYADQLEAGRLLERLFAQEPNHPGLAHYIIHAYDVPALAGQALSGAQRYSELAPDAPHALHTPSHTFTRLGLWQESISSNVAVAAWSSLTAGAKEEALRQMESAADMEDGTEKSVLTPGPLSPARELLGEMFLQVNDPAKALEQFEATMKKEPRRFRSLYGAAHAAQLIGSRALSQQYFGELLTVCAQADKPGRPEIKEAHESSAKQRH